MQSLRDAGLSFSNCWVNPTCSPTRASILTGKYGYRTDVKWAGDELSNDEKSLHTYLKEQGNPDYSTALIGKWHLSGNNNNADPESYGIDHFAGIPKGGVQDYYNWDLLEDGVNVQMTKYITETFTDLSIDWVSDQDSPWFLWLAYNAAHTPFHTPPSSMHSQGDLPEYTDDLDPLPYYLAAIEAMDFQIGRLLGSMTDDVLDNTVIIFIGDNGTPGKVAQSPYSSNTSKGSLYQGGVNVPLYLSGHGVDRIGLDDNLINGTDLFSTIGQLAGAIHDSQSFKPLLTEATTLREYQYAEVRNENTDQWAISNGKYKLIVDANRKNELYNLSIDPTEQNDLNMMGMPTADLNARNELEEELDRIRN